MRRALSSGLIAVAAAACGDSSDGRSACPAGETLSIIVFTRETQFMHPSTPVAAAALEASGGARGWRVEVSDDPGVFTDEQLTRTDAIVFSVTSGNILDADARARLEPWFRGGGGFAGTHSASSTEQEWPFWKELVPATFFTHPAAQQGTFKIESDDPIVAALPRPWLHTDELYTFSDRPEASPIHVLLSLDESQMDPAVYPNEFRVGFHPLAWTHENHGGRAFYTALGHTPESYATPLFMDVLERGIEWAGAPRHAERCSK